MTTTKTISFAELREFLQNLGYHEQRTEAAHLFHRANKDRLVFRRYADRDLVDQRDMLSTRTFLDLWGLVDTAEFDAFLERATPA